MNKKKLTLIVLVLLSMMTLVVVLNNKNSVDKVDNGFVEKEAKDLNPIEKSRALQILELEYGSELGNSEDDLKREGDYYVIDVYINLRSDEEHTHTEEDIVEIPSDSESTEGDIHKINLGIHNINVYTGDITKVEENE